MPARSSARLASSEFSSQAIAARRSRSSASVFIPLIVLCWRADIAWAAGADVRCPVPSCFVAADCGQTKPDPQHPSPVHASHIRDWLLGAGSWLSANQFLEHVARHRLELRTLGTSGNGA